MAKKTERKQAEGIRMIVGELEISHLEGTVLSAFFPEGRDITMKDIMQRTDYSYERVNTALKLLVEKKIVRERQVGKTLVYDIDMQNIYSESVGFNGYMLQKEIEFIKKYRTIYQPIKEIMNNPNVWMVVLFGSYSKSTEGKKSDVDILCLSNKKDDTEQFIKSLRYKYDVDFSPVVLRLEEFSDIKKDNPELWNDLKSYGIVFKGDGYFYYWMYKDEKN